MTPADYTLISITSILGSIIVLYGLNPRLGKWACKHLRWHIVPDSAANTDVVCKCERCGCKLFRDLDEVWRE